MTKKTLLKLIGIGLIITLLSLYLFYPEPTINITKSISLAYYKTPSLIASQIPENTPFKLNNKEFLLTKEEVVLSKNKKVASLSFHKQIQKPIELDTSFLLEFRANTYSCVTSLAFHSNSFNEFGLNINYSNIKSIDNNTSFYLDFTKLVIPHPSLATDTDLPYFLYYRSLFNIWGNGCYQINGVIRFYTNGNFTLDNPIIKDMSLLPNTTNLDSLVRLY